jgi:rhodanese-related sulfurtransferase
MLITPLPHIKNNPQFFNMNLQEIIRQKKGTILDVRTPAEFAGGHVMGSINIPLQEFIANVDRIKAMEGPLVLCCASGMRSGQAEQYLKSLGMNEVYNAGSWLDVNYYVNQN